MRARLVVFARNEAPGLMKTRLSPPLTPDEAAALSVAMAEALMERLSGFGSPPADNEPGPVALEVSCGADALPRLKVFVGEPVDLELRYSGEPSRHAAGDGDSPLSSTPDAGAGAGPVTAGCSEVPVPPSPSKGRRGSGGITVPPGWSAVPQGDGDLGDRLARAADAAVSAGVDHLVIVGADAPLLPLSLVEGAFTALRDRPVALAPAEDGGFVLLGLATGRLSPGAVASLLREVPWGAAEVFESTRRNAAAVRLEVALLPSSWDVDRPADLTRLRRAVAALAPADRPGRLHALLAGLPVGIERSKRPAVEAGHSQAR